MTKCSLLPSFAIDTMRPQHDSTPAPYMLDAMRAAAEADLHRPASTQGAWRMIGLRLIRLVRVSPGATAA